MIIMMMALAALQDATPQVHRLVVTTAQGAVTTQDYPTMSGCEAARTRVVSYNRRRTDEELRKQKGDRLDHLDVKAVCLPL